MRSSSVVLFAAWVLAVSALSAACMQQGEGEVCDTRAANNGNSDCQDGLVCTNQVASGTQGYRCCPGDPALATGVCALGQSNIPEDSAPPSSSATASAADATDGVASGAEAGEGGENGGAFAQAALVDGGLEAAATGDGAAE